MTKPSPTQPPRHGRTTHPNSGFYRRVSVKGSAGIAATVIVKTIRGSVWMSIMPPFTWEAIMNPAEVDELIHTLGLAKEDAPAGSGWTPRGHEEVVPGIASPAPAPIHQATLRTHR